MRAGLAVFLSKSGKRRCTAGADESGSSDVFSAEGRVHLFRHVSMVCLRKGRGNRGVGMVCVGLVIFVETHS